MLIHVHSLIVFIMQIVKMLNPNGILVELCRQRVSLLELDEKKFLEDAKAFDSRKMKLVMYYY